MTSQQNGTSEKRVQLSKNGKFTNPQLSSKFKLMHEYGHLKCNLMENMTKGLIYQRKHLIVSKHYRKKGIWAH